MPTSHKELLVWQKAMDLVVDVYGLSDRFPARERFGLTSQLRRAVVSVPTNIAEGSGRGSLNEYAHFVSIARGSLTEAETLLLLAQRLGFSEAGEVTDVLGRVSEVSRMLLVLRRRLKSAG